MTLEVDFWLPETHAHMSTCMYTHALLASGPSVSHRTVTEKVLHSFTSVFLSANAGNEPLVSPRRTDGGEFVQRASNRAWLTVNAQHLLAVIG